MVADKISAEPSIDYTVGYLSCKEFTGRDNAYVYYGSFDSMMKEINSLESSFYRHKHGKHTNYEFWDYYLLRLFDAMIVCQTATQDSMQENPPNHFTAATIRELGLRKRDKNILTAKTLTPGFYRNFEEFVDNNPSVTILDDTDRYQVLGIMHYNIGRNINYVTPDTTYWGFCDGKNVFVRHHFSFYQLERKDCAFYVASTLDVMRRDDNLAGWNLLFGLAGLTTGVVAKEGLYFGGFSALKPVDVPKIVIHQNDISLLGLTLDWNTGEISF